jgi:hypothetical protein
MVLFEALELLYVVEVNVARPCNNFRVKLYFLYLPAKCFPVIIFTSVVRLYILEKCDARKSAAGMKNLIYKYSGQIKNFAY